MTFSERTAVQIRRVMQNTPGLSERQFLEISARANTRALSRGVAFMVKGNMCCGVLDQNLVVRVGPDAYEGALREPHARPMDFTGRPLRGFVYVGHRGFASNTSLKQWIERGLSYVSTLPPK
jgi:hypothetical protein